MIFPLLLMFTVLPFLTSGSVMNLAELSSVQYSLKIARDPVIENTPQNVFEPSLTMVNMNGQKYTCSLPETPDFITDGVKAEDESEVDIDHLLNPLESAPCMLLTKDWWTYEVCYKRDIKQYHVEGGAPVGVVILLGTHSPGKDSVMEPNKTYHPQWYGNGSRCDLTGQMRQAEVRFICDEAASREFVGDILEHQSCEYRVFVHTSRLCGVARMRTAEGTTPLPIVCHPVLDQDQMDKYKLFKERSKMARQLKKQQRRQDQSLQLVKQMGPRQRGIKRVVTRIGAVDGMMEMMGDKMMEKILNEVDTMLDASLSTLAGEGINENKNKQSSAPIPSSTMNQNLKDGTDLLEEDHVISLTSLQDLVGKRNVLWDRIVEARKTLEQFKAELMATESRLFSIKLTEENVEKIAGLEMKWRSLEVAVGSIHSNIAKLESQANSVTQRILLMKNKLKEGRMANVPSHNADENNLNDESQVAESKVKVEDAKHESKFPYISDQTETITEEYESVTEVTTLRAAKKDTSDEGLGGNIKISISKLSDDDDDPEEVFDTDQAEKIVTKLEGMIKNKLSRHGLTNSGKPIEVKLITARLPEGAENENDRQLNSMFYNMMVGDVEGYEDINQVRKDEENYGFAWKEEMFSEMEQKIENLKHSGADADLVDKMLQNAIQQDDDIKNFWVKTDVKKSSESTSLDDEMIVNNIVDETLDGDTVALTYNELMDDFGQKEEPSDSVVLQDEDVVVDDVHINRKEESKDAYADSDDVPEDADDKNGIIQVDPTKKKEL